MYNLYRILSGRERMVLEITGIILEVFVTFFEVVSAVLIVFGGLKAALEILLVEAFKKPYSYEHIRKRFTNKIFFGLELLIVADVLETLRKPSLEELLLVGAIVVIRSYLGYFLSKEAEEYQFD
ncbi:MAG: hypothetical protein QG610_26 [Euryarchaeota archaeon]|nr:hypothetical protein [Euryarchaeota archaeon]